jgi:hypothetical protein
MRKVILMIVCAIVLVGCTREEVQDGIASSLRGACAQRAEDCTVHCGAGEVADGRGQCRKE